MRYFKIDRMYSHSQERSCALGILGICCCSAYHVPLYIRSMIGWLGIGIMCSVELHVFLQMVTLWPNATKFRFSVSILFNLLLNVRQRSVITNCFTWIKIAILNPIYEVLFIVVYGRIVRSENKIFKGSEKIVSSML